MAGRGPAPKATASRDRDALRRQGKTGICADGEVRGPALPGMFVADHGEERDWHPMTVAWWETWRTSAQAQIMVDTDWSFMLDTALMHDAMWSKGQWVLAAEVRLRVAKFGATPEDRLRLKLEIEAPFIAEPASVTLMDAYRQAAQ